MTAWVSGDWATQTRKTRQPIFDLLRFFIHSRPQVGAKHTRITALVFARCGWVLSKILRILADSCGAARCGTVRHGAVRCGTVRHGAARCGTVRGGAGRCGAGRWGAVTPSVRAQFSDRWLPSWPFPPTPTIHTHPPATIGWRPRESAARAPTPGAGPGTIGIDSGIGSGIGSSLRARSGFRRHILRL